MVTFCNPNFLPCIQIICELNFFLPFEHQTCLVPRSPLFSCHYFADAIVVWYFHPHCVIVFTLQMLLAWKLTVAWKVEGCLHPQAFMPRWKEAKYLQMSFEKSQSRRTDTHLWEKTGSKFSPRLWSICTCKSGKFEICKLSLKSGFRFTKVFNLVVSYGSFQFFFMPFSLYDKKGLVCRIETSRPKMYKR